MYRQIQSLRINFLPLISLAVIVVSLAYAGYTGASGNPAVTDSNGQTVTSRKPNPDNTPSNARSKASPMQQFCNTTAITIPSSGSATPYPSGIAISGVTGVIGDMSVTLNNIQHSFSGDVDILLVGPGGQKFIILSDVGGSDGFDTARTITLSDAGTALLIQSTDPIPSGTYKPTNYGTGDTFTTVAAPYLSPATAGSATFESAFGLTDPVGTWNLYVVDDAGGGGGTISGGWCIDMNVIPPSPGQLQFATNAYTHDEAGGAKTITVNRTAGNVGQVTVDYATGGGTAAGGAACGPGVDYVNTSGTLTLPAAVMSATFNVTLCNDTEFDLGETFNISLSNPGGGAILGTPATTTFTITRFDSVCNTAPLTIPLVGPASLYPSTIPVAGIPGNIDEVSVKINNLQHFVGFQVRMLLVGPGGQKFVPMTSVGNDTIFDTAVTFTLADAGVSTIPTPPVANGVYRPTSASPPFAVEAFPAPAPGLPYAIPGPSGGVETFESVFTGISPNGDWKLYVEDVQDFSDGGSGSISGGWCLGFTTQLPNPGTIQLVESTYSAFETDGVINVEARRIGGAQGIVSANLASADGSATGGASCTTGVDYVSINGPVTFADGEVGKKTIPVQLCRDNLTSEVAETFNLQLSGPTGGAVLGTPTAAGLTINNSSNSVVGIRPSDYSGTDFQAGQVAVRVIRQGVATVADSVDYLSSGGTATAGATCSAGVDYITAAGTVTFGPNEFSKDFFVDICPDADIEPEETFNVSLTNPSVGATISAADTSGRVTLVENQPTIYTVNSLNDITDGFCNPTHCNLREAVILANGAPSADEIRFDPAVFGVARTISLTKGFLPITSPLTITGSGMSLLTISTNHNERLFRTSSVVSISGLTSTGGVADGGITNTGTLDLTAVRFTAINPIDDFRGVVQNDGGTVTLTECLIDANDAISSEGGLFNGGGGTMNVIRTTIANNRGDTSGGGIRNDDSTLNVENSTISGNETSFQGGGIFVWGGTANIKHSTITGNQSDNDGTTSGGIETFGTGTVKISNSIVAGNTGSTTITDLLGNFTSQGNNLIGAATVFTGMVNGANGDKVGSSVAPLNAVIGPLASNGGPTQTRALLDGSPAIDGGHTLNSLPTDQRSIARPFDGNVDGTPVSDIGAFELNGTPGPSPTPVPTPVPGATFTVTNTDNNGAGSLRQAVLDANVAAGANTITFDTTVFSTPQTITLTSGDIVFTNSANSNATIIGPGANLLTISGNTASKIFTALETPVVSISGMTLTGGNGVGTAPGNTFGGAIYNQGDMTLTDMVITANTSASDGGGVYNSTDDVMRIVNCVISNNTSNSDGNTSGLGGGILNIGNMTITGSTISGNTAAGTNLSGGGIYSERQLAILNSTITGNRASGSGGGITFPVNSTGAFMTVSNSTISDNIANFDITDNIGNGGGIFTGNDTTVFIFQSAITGNSALGSSPTDVGGNGGGIRSGGDLTVTNTTISGNNAGRDGAGIYAVSNTFNITTVASSTIVNNTAIRDFGGISGDPDQPVNVRNSIVANNLDDGSGSDVGRLINSQGYNLIENTTGATISGDTATNINGQDPNLGPLGNNGGTTNTHALLLGSPANNAANPTEYPPTDQRGAPRPAYIGMSRPDIGALDDPALTASGVTVSGRVLTAEGRGLTNAFVTLTAPDGTFRVVRTTRFGSYRFDDVAVGETYVISVRSRRFLFAPRVLQVFDELTDINFTPE